MSRFHTFTPAHRLEPYRFIAALVVALSLLGACMSDPTPPEAPPEREFDQSTAWQRLEAAAAEAIADLPDFPGFEVRVMLFHACEHQGVVNEDYISLELTYQFSEETSRDPLVREAYLELLRQRWRSAGYDIHRDKASGTGRDHSLEARRSDGINYWYSVAPLTALIVQSGCVKAVDDWEPAACPAPLGGVTGDNDRARKHCAGFPDDIEYDTDAIDPFASDPPGPPGG